MNKELSKDIVRATPIIYKSERGFSTNTDSTYKSSDIVFDKTIETTSNSIDEKTNESPVIINEWK